MVADIAKADSGPGGVLHPRAGHRPRAVPVRPRRVARPVERRRVSMLGLEGEASVAGFQAMFEGRDPTTGELLGRPHGRNAAPAFDVVLRPNKSVSSSTASATRRPDGCCWPPTMPGWPRPLATWTSTWGLARGHGGVQHVSGQALLAVGFDHRTSREGDPLLHTHVVIANRVQGPDGRWTALDGRDLYRPAGRGRHLPGHLPARARPDTGGGVDGGGHLRDRGAGGHARGLVRRFSKRTDDRGRAGSAGRGRSGADAAAGQVDGAGHPHTEGARGTGHPVRPVAAGGGRARARTRTPSSAR